MERLAFLACRKYADDCAVSAGSTVPGLLIEPISVWGNPGIESRPSLGWLRYLFHRFAQENRLVGLVVKASASRAEDPEFDFMLVGILSGRVIPVT